MMRKRLTLSLTFVILVAMGAPAMSATSAPKAKVRTSQAAERRLANRHANRRSNRLARKLRIVGKKTLRALGRWLNPGPNAALMRVYRRGEISHNQLETLHRNLIAAGEKGIAPVVEATRPKRSYTTDPVEQMTARLKAMVARRGWVD